jgi:hypothetical protein
MSDIPGFGNRKFSINRNTGVPRPCRRFSIGEPGVNGTDLHWEQDTNSLLTSCLEASSKVHRQFRAAHEGCAA